jgi:hypothetical protein
MEKLRIVIRGNWICSELPGPLSCRELIDDPAKIAANA